MTAVKEAPEAASIEELRRGFRNVFSELASGVCVVTFWREGRLHGFTATSVTSVSLHPLRVLFCVAETSRSYPLLRKGSVIGISILSEEQRALSDRFASKLALGAYDDVEIADRSDGAPLIEGALGHITAEIAGLIPSGDHVIVLCDVTSARVASTGSPLLYCRRSYHRLHHSL